MEQKDFLNQIEEFGSDVHNYDEACKRLFVRLINYERSKEELEDAVYKKVGEIAMTVYLRVSLHNETITSTKVKDWNLKEWGKSEQEVFDLALINTGFMAPARLLRWENLLLPRNYTFENFMEESYDHEIAPGGHGLCLTTEFKVNGAVAIFLPLVADRLCELMDDDLYLAFTSIHEVMVHRKHEADAEFLMEVLHDTIEQTTPEEDFLSDKLYWYSREEKVFRMVEV